MTGQHHQCNEHELGQTPGDGEGQGGLAHCGPWDHKQLDIAGSWTLLATGQQQGDDGTVYFFWKRCNRGNNEQKRSPRGTG